jgi:parafibromin
MKGYRIKLKFPNNNSPFLTSLELHHKFSSTQGGCITFAAKARMAALQTLQHDPLLLLRQSIAADTPAIPTTVEEASSPASEDISLAVATHLRFSSPFQASIPLETPTRFISSDQPVDLRSIYFAWLNREVAIPEYNASALALNTELTGHGGAGGKVQNLAFVERLDLITWLEGASEESEYIKPLPSDSSSTVASAQVASGAVGGIAPISSGATGRQVKTIDPRLAEIYNGERRMGDRNSILRGIKPTVGQTTPVARCDHADCGT